MKYSFDHYLNTLQTKKTNIKDLIDTNKIFNNMQEIEADLNSLNYLICINQKEFDKRLDFLFKSNNKCFKSIFLLLAIRYEKNIEFYLNNKLYRIDDILEDKQKIKSIFYESGIMNFILKGKIKNFIDYAFGVEVGMDTNARKNRNGSNIENKIYNELTKLFKDYQFIIIREQQKINKIDSKKIFDIVIENKNTNKKILIESSFYNSGGSKISETARSYHDLYKKISSFSNNYSFIWLADGYGMTTIRKILIDNFSSGYIFNHEMLYKNIKKIVLDD